MKHNSRRPSEFPSAPPRNYNELSSKEMEVKGLARSSDVPFMQAPTRVMPLESLLDRGVLPETVRQLREMAKYLCEAHDVGISFVDRRVPSMQPTKNFDGDRERETDVLPDSVRVTEKRNRDWDRDDRDRCDDSRELRLADRSRDRDERDRRDDRSRGRDRDRDRGYQVRDDQY